MSIPIPVLPGAPISHLPRAKLGALTGIRFLAAWAVVCFHSGASFLRNSGAPLSIVQFFENGFIGVSIFFVLSGYILCYTYRDGVASLPLFLWSRFARIYPVYIFTLFLFLPLVYHKVDFAGAAKVLLMIQSWTPYTSISGFTWMSPAWTLSVELGFYLLFPVFAKLMLQRSFAWNIFFAAFLAGIIIFLGSPAIAPGSVRGDLPNWLAYVPLPLLRLPEFLIGIALCNVRRLQTGDIGLSLSSGLSFAIVFLIVAMMQFATSQYWMLGAISVLGALLIYLLSGHQTMLARILSSKALLVLGGASYAMYLLHTPIRAWMGVLMPSDRLAQISTPIILIPAAIFVFYLLETPARTFILRTRLRQSQTAARNGR